MKLQDGSELVKCTIDLGDTSIYWDEDYDSYMICIYARRNSTPEASWKRIVDRCHKVGLRIEAVGKAEFGTHYFSRYKGLKACVIFKIKTLSPIPLKLLSSCTYDARVQKVDNFVEAE
jgi:hypothetical protein